MSNKAIFVLLLTLCAAQGARILTPHNESTAELNSIIDEVKELWEKLKTAVENAINKAEDKVKEAFEKVKAKAMEVFNKGKDKINEIINSFEGELAELKEKAKEAGVDISDCTKDNEPALTALGEKLIEDLESCVTDKVNEAEGIVNDVIAKFKETYDNVMDYGRQIEECSSVTYQRNVNNEFTCIMKLIGKITLEITELPLSIATDVLHTVELIEELESSLETCATLKVAKATANGAQILADITKCVNDKIDV